MFKISDKLTKENYTKGAIWCRQNNATINQDWVIVDVPQPTQEEINAKRISELKAKLAATDYIVIKIAEGAATREEYEEVLEQRESWRDEINELEELK